MQEAADRLGIGMTEADRRFYDERLQAFLPETLIDIHTHVWWGSNFPVPRSDGGGRTVTWPSRVAAENPIKQENRKRRKAGNAVQKPTP